MSVPLAEGIKSNKEFVMQYLMDALSKLFPNLNKVFLESTIIGMFNKCENREEFKQVLRDLLVTMKEFAESNDELYAEELEVRARESLRNYDLCV